MILPNLIVFLSGFLLFQIQPMMAKKILPSFGGGASVWLVSLFFFQSFLFLGYWASHWGRKKWSPRKHLILELIFYGLSFFFLPLRLLFLPDLELPFPLEVFLLCTFSIGLPFLVLSTLSPLLQHWFSLDPRQENRNPYILYGSSNLGSLSGLLTYPFVFEPNFTLIEQGWMWFYGYAVLGVLLLLYGLGWWNRLPKEEKKEESPLPFFPWSLRTQWILWSFLPSASLLAITHHLTRDIVTLPFLWVLPLALYLLSFIFCFYFPSLSLHTGKRTLFWILPIWALVIYSLAHYYLMESGSLLFPVLLGCWALFAMSMYFHGNLEREKPGKESLTYFYLHLCFGGALGGFFVSWIAPLLFPSPFEFYLTLWMALIIMSLPHSRTWEKPLRMFYYTTMMAFFTINFYMEMTNWHPQMLYKGRSFYNAYRIVDYSSEDHSLSALLLFQGSTIHGGEFRNEKDEKIPLSYYHPKTGIAQVFSKLSLQKIGVIGLGSGVLSLYGKKGQTMDFFEIDPLVVDLAKNRFTLLSSCEAQINIYVGDGRKKLSQIPSHSYDLFILDAFTSDAIPTHLLTLEAMDEYLRVLKPGGVLFFNISNRYVNLLPVLRGSARKLNLHLSSHAFTGKKEEFTFSTLWAVMARSSTAWKDLCGEGGWKEESPGESIEWHDDFNYLWPLLQWQSILYE